MTHPVRSPQRQRNRSLFILCFGLVWLALGTATSLRAGQEDLRKHLLVLFNPAAADSERLARYYAEKRQIPGDHVLGLECPDKEEIDRATFEEKIRAPLERFLISKGWIKRQPSTIAIGPKTVSINVAVENEIWVIVLMRGMPLKIANDPAFQPPPYLKAELHTNGASVDSELATFPINGMPPGGPTLNPYYFAGYAREFDALDARRQILVTRLDAPKAESVQRMIDDSLTAEANRLAGYACLDARDLTDKKNPYSQGDDWLRNALVSLSREGWPIEFDNRPELIAPTVPITQVALYAGWYEEHARGPFFQPPRRFATGAVAYHLHSFSASTLRSETANWVGPLVTAGAAATMGSVYEPYLDLTPHIDIFIDRLLQGFTFAEAAYMSQKGLSWMITMVGDPLYRPFAAKLPEALARAREKNALNIEWLELQQARLDLQHGTLAATDLKTRLITDKSSEVSWEGYGDLLSSPGVKPNTGEIAAAYKQALALYFGAVDQIRVGLKLTHLYEQVNRRDSARAVLKQLMARWPKDSAFYGIDAEIARLSKGLPPTASLPGERPPDLSTSAPVVAPVTPETPATATNTAPPAEEPPNVP